MSKKEVVKEPEYFVFDDNDGDITGPFDSLEEAKKDAHQRFEDYEGSAPDDTSLRVLLCVGAVHPPEETKGVWKDA